MSESSTTSTTANPATKTKNRNQRRRTNNNRNKKPSSDSNNTTENNSQNNTDTTNDKDKKGDKNPRTRTGRNKPSKTNTSSKKPLGFSPHIDNTATTSSTSTTNRKKNTTYIAELKKLNTLQTAELELVKARLGAKNFTLYKSSKEQKTFAVTSVVSVNKRQQRVRFTVSVPREYPNTPVKLGTLLTPEYSPSTNTSINTTNSNTEIAVTEQQWKSNTVKNFNNECKQLLLEQNQPLIQQLNNFVVNFIEMSNKRPNEFAETRELKKQLLQELVFCS